MPYFHTIDTAQKFSKLALKRITEDNLSPVPENYEVWFVYYSNALPDLVKVVDDLLKDNDGKLSDDKCYSIYGQFFGYDNVDTTVRRAGDQIQETIGKMNVTVASARRHAVEYGDSLNSFNENLQGKSDQNEINTLVGGVLSDTVDMIDNNDNLQEMLESSNQAIDDMRRDLEIARKEALTDAMTGLANRKAFDQEIEYLVELANGEELSTFSMIFFDIDFFKNFNDKFGHQIGDQVLKLVARTLKDGIKGRDIAVRYGGEEFVILLPETNIHGSMKVAEALRKEVENKELVNRSTGKKIAKITLSAGVSEYIKGESMDGFVGRVDAALYSSKDAGRNQVTSA